MNTSKLRVGVIGFGYWGPNLVRNFAALEDSEVTLIADFSEERRHLAARAYPTVPVIASGHELATSDRVDAVAIATPAASHFELASAAIERGKHVLISKPLARNHNEVDRLIALAERHSVVLMVDHTFVYTGAVRKMRELVAAGELGDLYYYFSTRVNLGLLQDDVNVLWDLAVHDLAILDYLIEEEPRAVQAVSSCSVGRQEEVATLCVKYSSGFTAHVHVSWLSPVKMRLTTLTGSAKMIVYDDVEPSEKVKVYDKGVDLAPEDVTTAKPIYRAGDVFIPALDRTEALETEARHFIDCIRRDRRPQTGGRSGLRVVRMLEAAGESLDAGGNFVPLEV